MVMNLIVLEEAESTQDIAKELALRGEPEGTAVMAFRQTKGRGRSGHSWVSPAGKNLAVSVILRPGLRASEAPLLGFLVAIAVAELVEARGVPSARLKWPNDVLVDGRKIAGILPEAVLVGDAVSVLIAGIGLNVNSEASDFPPDLRDAVTSLTLCTGRPAGLEEIARDLLARLETLYQRMQREGCGFIMPLWERRWAHRGMLVTHEAIRGRAVGVAPDGALLVHREGGTVTRVISGEVIPSSEAGVSGGRHTEVGSA